MRKGWCIIPAGSLIKWNVSLLAGAAVSVEVAILTAAVMRAELGVRVQK